MFGLRKRVKKLEKKVERLDDDKDTLARRISGIKEQIECSHENCSFKMYSLDGFTREPVCICEDCGKMIKVYEDINAFYQDNIAHCKMRISKIEERLNGNKNS